MRALVLVLSAGAAVIEAMQLALDDGKQVTWQHLAAAGTLALFTWAAKSPWDVSKKDASEQVARARRGEL